MEQKPKYLNEKQVSEMTNIALPTLRNYRHLGKGPSYLKIGRSIRYSTTDVIEFMESHKIMTD
jgi:predicted DNA-binding transcriptional regulator AlpA